MKKLLLVCLCLLSTCSSSKSNDLMMRKRFVWYRDEGRTYYVDRQYNVVCYKFGSYTYSCVHIPGAEL
jgi:hypothetical protein